VVALDLIGAWVNAGKPETDPFEFASVEGKTCIGSFAKDVQPLFVTPNLWFKGALACASCHTSDIENAAANMSLGSYAGLLDEQGRNYLQRIQEASRRMGRLINDLLNLSRVSRTELSYQKVDLSALAQSVAEELKAQDPLRQVVFDISDQIFVNGDADLLKIALENLHNNAFKFTSLRERALIQVGMFLHPDETVYFVRDNGTGFNMEYADKLFAPFQRLHNAREYPGTGIGLSIVQTMFKVDVFILKQRSFDLNQMQRRILQLVGDSVEQQAFFSTSEDIILAKLEWFRLGGEVSERQWRDVIGVMDFQSDQLVMEVMEQDIYYCLNATYGL
jgi:Histidine kinase-, DNA gyrase B-, and HSP90-like ATPase